MENEAIQKKLEQLEGISKAHSWVLRNVLMHHPAAAAELRRTLEMSTHELSLQALAPETAKSYAAELRSLAAVVESPGTPAQ